MANLQKALEYAKELMNSYSRQVNFIHNNAVRIALKKEIEKKA